MRKLLLTGLAFVCALLVASCSVATMAYNNAPSIALYALDDYFDLSPEQEAWLKPRLERFIAWHRTNELPAYRRLVNEASYKIGSGARAEDARALYDSGRARLARAADYALPEIAAFLAQLTPRQITRLEAKLAEDNRKMEEEWRMQPAMRQQKRVEKSIERFEDWFGTLSTAQTEKIRATMMAMPPLDAMRLADRKRRQAELIALLKSPPPPEVMQIALRRMMLQPELGRDAVFQAELDQQLEATVNLVMALLAEGSPAQRARVQKRLNGYIEDINSLTRS